MTMQTTPESKPMVTFVDAVKMAFRKYADFEGRSTRAEYWWRLLFISIASIVFSTIDSFVGSLRGWSSYGPFEAIFTLATLMPGLAVTARRLHDFGKTGWWQLAWYAIPLMAWITTLVLFVIAIAIAFSVVPDLDVNIWDFDSDDIGWTAGLAFLQAIVMFVIALVVTLAVVVWAIVWTVR